MQERFVPPELGFGASTPIIEADSLALHVEFAFTSKERRLLIERDGGKCQFPGKHDCGGGQLHIHHILPQRYAEAVGIEDWDFPENGITLCKNSHLQKVHPDMGQALKEYHKNPDVIKDVFKEREEKIANREPYWNTTWDRQFLVLAIRNTQRARKKGWKWNGED